MTVGIKELLILWLVLESALFLTVFLCYWDPQIWIQHCYTGPRVTACAAQVQCADCMRISPCTVLYLFIFLHNCSAHRRLPVFLASALRVLLCNVCLYWTNTNILLLMRMLINDLSMIHWAFHFLLIQLSVDLFGSLNNFCCSPVPIE